MSEVKLKRIVIKYYDGSEVFSTEKETAEEIFELFRSDPAIIKQDAYIRIGERILFLENVKEIKFNLKD